MNDSKALEVFSDERLLAEVLRRNKCSLAPKKRTFVSKHFDFTIGIGKDHHVSITIDEDAYKELLLDGKY